MDKSIGSLSIEVNKMEEVAASDLTPNASVSFGRFENDSLSWDKWSSFSQNKYLEEVEKCATPGSVAKKAAYFEAHYKKIAARKVELLGQDQEEDGSLSSNEGVGGDLAISKTSEMDSGVDVNGREDPVEEVKRDAVFESEVARDEHNEDVAIKKKAESKLAEEMEEDKTENKPEEAATEKGEEALEVMSPAMKELQETEHVTKDSESTRIAKDLSAKSQSQKALRKINPISKAIDATGVKKKPVSPSTKSPQVSTARPSKAVSSATKSPQVATARASKPVSTPSTLTGLWSSTKKPVGLSSPGSKIAPVRENQKVTPRSLHMSISFDAPNSDPAHLTSTKKSFIMEKMGDKDIVRRAFKTFQNNFNQLKASVEMKSLGAKQMPASGREVKAPTTTIPRKDNAGSTKRVFADKRTAKASPSSLVSKSDERADKKKELYKKSDDKSGAKVADRSHPRITSKEGKEEENKTTGQKLNSKKSTLPGSSRGQRLSKSPLDKVGSKTLRF